MKKKTVMTALKAYMWKEMESNGTLMILYREWNKITSLAKYF